MRSTWSARPGLLGLVELAILPPGKAGLPALAQASLPDLIVGDHGDGRVESVLHHRLEQQRHLDDGGLGAGLEPLAPAENVGTHPWVQPGLEPDELARVREDDLGHPSAVDLAVWRHPLPPALDQSVAHLGVGEQLMGDLVGREGGGPQPREGCEGLRLPCAYAAREPNEASQAGEGA